MTVEAKLLVIFLCFIFYISWYPSNAKVVVFFPTPVMSHVRYHMDVARAMADQGHEAWVCLPDYQTKTYFEASGIKVLYYANGLGKNDEIVRAVLQRQGAFWRNETTWMHEIVFLGERFNDIYVYAIEDFIDQVKELNPHLFVIDSVPFNPVIYFVPYKLNIPYAVLGSDHEVTSFRIPFSPAATPFQMGIANDCMDFWERCQTAVTYFTLKVLSSIMERDVVSAFAPEKPHKTLTELIARAEVFILDLDPIMDYPRPMLPNTKLIGGISAKKAKPLKKPFKSFVENSKTGVIVITFGSTVVNVPEYIFNKIHTACKRSGLDIVWRSDQPSPDPKKILTSEWIPQNDVLGHNNTKLFISHCGKNGQYEALYHGVPILCLPMFADQPYNAERVRSKGYGLKADIRSISTDDLSDMIGEMMTNTTYKNNIAKASKLFRLLYKSPLQEAAFWLDHVMEYGGDYMRAASQKMPHYQFLMLDVLAIFLCVIHVIGFILFVMIRSFVRCCLRRKASKFKSE